MCPWAPLAAGVFNPATNTYVTYSTPSNYYAGAVLLPDGLALLIPAAAGNVAFFNPITNVTTAGPAGNGYAGGALLPNGRVIMAIIILEMRALELITKQADVPRSIRH